MLQLSVFLQFVAFETFLIKKLNKPPNLTHNTRNKHKTFKTHKLDENIKNKNGVRCNTSQKHRNATKLKKKVAFTITQIKNYSSMDLT